LNNQKRQKGKPGGERKGEKKKKHWKGWVVRVEGVRARNVGVGEKWHVEISS